MTLLRFLTFGKDIIPGLDDFLEDDYITRDVVKIN